jgi:predicted regulator of Ras-like GTPase activity (Roadblock/LC7/MglB family)
MDALNDVPKQLRDSLRGFLSTDVVHIDSGMSLGGQSFNVDFDIATAAARYADLVRSSRETLDMIGVSDPTTQDILMTTDQRHTLLRRLNDDYVHVLIVERDANLGMCRAKMRQVAPDLIAAVS